MSIFIGMERVRPHVPHPLSSKPITTETSVIIRANILPTGSTGTLLAMEDAFRHLLYREYRAVYLIVTIHVSHISSYTGMDHALIDAISLL